MPENNMEKLYQQDIAWRRSRQAYVRDAGIFALTGFLCAGHEWTHEQLAVEALNAAEALANELARREAQWVADQLEGTKEPSPPEVVIRDTPPTPGVTPEVTP